MTAARTFLLAAVAVAGLAGATLLWRALTQSTHPRGLLEIALAQYADAPQLEPFAYQAEKPEGDKRQRLFDVSEPHAREMLSGCSIDGWKPAGSLQSPTNGDVEGERLMHLWECDSNDGKVLAAELWKPHMGAAGVYFAACRRDKCPAYPQAFPEIRAWLGNTFEPVADRRSS